MTDSEKIKQLIAHYGDSTMAFERRIGINTTQILYDIIKGKTGISKDLTKKITEKLTDINTTWLLTGEGEMLLNSKPNHEQEEINNDKLIMQLRAELEEKKKQVESDREYINKLLALQQDLVNIIMATSKSKNHEQE